MSADDAYYVQNNSRGQVVVQYWFASADELPDPDTATAEQTFSNIEEAVLKFKDDALETEYGFQFRLNMPNLDELKEKAEMTNPILEAPKVLWTKPRIVTAMQFSGNAMSIVAWLNGLVLDGERVYAAWYEAQPGYQLDEQTVVAERPEHIRIEDYRQARRLLKEGMWVVLEDEKLIVASTEYVLETYNTELQLHG
jgi:hypothetical protein